MARPWAPVKTDRKLLLFKWLMILIPPATLALGHIAIGLPAGRHDAGATLLVTSSVALLALVLAYLLAEGMFRVLRRLQAEALERQQDVLTMNAVMRERERLSRELHDGVAQIVAHLLLRLDTIEGLVEAGRGDEARAELERLRGVADEIYEDIGESITGLRTNVAERGLIRAVQEYVEQFEERHEVAVTLRADAAADRLSPLAAFQLFRIVQEALTNVRKYADARRATVTLAPDGEDRLRVVVADDGRGFASKDALGAETNGRSRPLGLTSMRERVEALGGTFEVSSRPGAGTQVIAIIPIPQATREPASAAVATAAS